MVDQNALLVLRKRYLIRDEAEKPTETPEGLFQRVAGFMARAEDNFKGGQREKTEEAFYAMLSNLEFLPNSPTLMNAVNSGDSILNSPWLPF